MVGVMMCTVLGVANADADNTAEPWGSGRSYSYGPDNPFSAAVVA